MGAFLLMLREGVEAALIVAILLAYLERIGRSADRRSVWAGTLAAVIVSLGAGWALWATIGGLEGEAEEITEGLVALVAVVMLTWMVLWMARQARGLRGALESKVDAAVLAGSGAVALIAFVAVVREGFESALFMISTTVGDGAPLTQLLGGILGVAGAVVIGYLFYRSSHLIDLRAFFRVTGTLIILFAAGLLAKGIHEFQEVGILPTLVEHVWNVGFLDPETSVTGRWLGSLFGWDQDPSLLMVLGYFAYLLPAASSFLRATRVVPAVKPIEVQAVS